MLWKTLNKERFEDATNGGRWGKREDIFCEGTQVEEKELDILMLVYTVLVGGIQKTRCKYGSSW